MSHAIDVTPQPTTLEEIKEQIFETIDRAAMRTGELLHLARQKLSKRDFERWVTEELPFGVDTAKRLRAVYLAHSELPPKVLSSLPRPWQAMYALAAVPRSELEAAVSDGRLQQDMTVEQTRAVARRLNGHDQKKGISVADQAVRRIVNLPVDSLTSCHREMLTGWLEGSGEGTI